MSDARRDELASIAEELRLARMVEELRSEFGDPIAVWGRTGADAWVTVVGMLAHIGWKAPDDRGRCPEHRDCDLTAGHTGNCYGPNGVPRD